MSKTYRRLYRCPECGHKGKNNNRDRSEPEKQCPSCGEWFYLQEKVASGFYESGNEPVNKMEFEI